MVQYIDPVGNIGGFGDVQNAMLTLDADALQPPDGGGAPSFPASLSLVPPLGADVVAAKVPGWVLVAIFVGFLLLVNERRTA